MLIGLFSHLIPIMTGSFDDAAAFTALGAWSSSFIISSHIMSTPEMR